MTWRPTVERPSGWRVIPTGRCRLAFLLGTVFLGGILLPSGCRRDGNTPSNGGDADPAPKVRDLLIFPDVLYVEDPRVNEFVGHAMAVCAAGDYDEFRLLWSAREEPLPRKEYEKGWQAVQEIRIQGLERVLLDAKKDGKGASSEQTVYALLAEVSMDPDHPAAAGEPTREVALMLVHEHEEWRLAKTPKSMRTWLKERFKKQADDGESSSTSRGG